ncbi:MAG TPA: pyrimidine dimer DNA glycosylase/endonuclease V [Nitrospira sp.]|nr:pyrimidine dimer DNA glycosylase/endonuclease V [Nitrospira sp.]
MRIWDISPKKLCRNHLLGEHRELHAIWSVLIHRKKGYAHHPETLRWKGKLKALYGRHEALVNEMAVRGYRHRSPLAKKEATGGAVQRVFVDPPRQQVRILKNKRCQCDV